jgi:hypothetical protein
MVIFVFLITVKDIYTHRQSDLLSP